MNISGTTQSNEILDNTPFILSGLSQDNQAAVNVTDTNGLDVSQCFGITTNIITVSGDNVIHSGECDTSLEIIITEGIVDGVVCDFTGTTLQSDGLILLTYSDSSTSLNVHPDCCAIIDSNYISEIGDEGYYVCRWREIFVATDCNNYTPTDTFDVNDYMIFNISIGGTTTVVPSTQCCAIRGLEDVLTNEGVKCKEVAAPICDGYRIEVDVPDIGDAEFTILATGVLTTVVPTFDCCRINELSGREVNGGWSCYKALNPPRVEVLLSSNCCDGGGLILDILA